MGSQPPRPPILRPPRQPSPRPPILRPPRQPSPRPPILRPPRQPSPRPPILRPLFTSHEPAARSSKIGRNAETGCSQSSPPQCSGGKLSSRKHLYYSKLRLQD